MPTVAFPPAVPLTVQVTLVFVVLLTVAVNCCVVETMTTAEVGLIEIVTAGGGGAAPPPPPQPVRRHEERSAAAKSAEYFFIRNSRPEGNQRTRIGS